MASSLQCTSPLRNLSDVLSWNSGGFAPYVFNQKVTTFDRNNKLNCPKVLVCHDMKGGYLADRFDDVCFSPAEDGFGFSYWNWLNTDIFVYFSHELVTIPPYSWIETAKANGVKILGTFITEFNDGETIWTTELNNPFVIDRLVDKLVELTIHYGFDGWLLNIENEVCQQVHLLQRLICKLSANIHETVPGGIVIWYDSVTYPDGNLKWQNELNNKNDIYFDSCDGIFLNYTWTDENLEKSLEFALKKNRQFDVYVGVDVFGRNCFGGGGFNTKLAVRKAMQTNLSVAIFAFGWVFETLPVCDFLKNQQIFWSLLNDLLPANKAYVVPFSTVFATSYGKELFWLGEKCLSKGPWYYLPLQTPCQTLAKESTDVSCFISNEHGAFIGSSSLEITIEDSGNVELFPIHFPAEDDYYLCVGYKWLRCFDEATASLSVTDCQDKIFCNLPLKKKVGNEWHLDSLLFRCSCQEGTVRLVTTGCNSRVLIGYIGIFNAALSKSGLEQGEIIDQIKRDVRLYNALIC